MAGVIYKVKSFEDLKNNMDIFQISPDIAWKHIVASKKLDLTDKSIWKMRKFELYISLRIHALERVILKLKDKPEMKKYKMKDPKIIKNAVKYLIPKRKATIRTMIESKVYKILFDDFWKNKKKPEFDSYKGILNLEKLILRKDQNKWFDPFFYKKKNNMIFFKDEDLDWLIKIIR